MLHYDSCVYETEVLEALVKRVGADRVVLGSDYPVGEPKPIEFVKSCALSVDEKEKIIGLNAARLFRMMVSTDGIGAAEFNQDGKQAR